MDFGIGLWIGGVIGAAFGIWLQKKAMHNIMRIKAIDGTAEYINGEFYYILNDEDYCQYVLGINKEQVNDD